MKERIISAIVALLVFIPIFIIGGTAFNICFYILTLLGLKEFMDAKEKEKKYPDFIRLISYIMITFLYFGNMLNENLNYILDYRLISGIFLVLLIPVVLYHNKKVYNVIDAFSILGMLLFLGLSMSLFYTYRSIDLSLIIFLFLISIITDTYAYLIGKFIGRNKFVEEISPNKTWEGTIGGSLVATFVCTVYYTVVINSNILDIKMIFIILFLSIIGQFGDLLFSAIKRNYNIKDFSNIMPGHGGILDRLDSILFIALTYTFFLEIL